MTNTVAEILQDPAYKLAEDIINMKQQKLADMHIMNKYYMHAVMYKAFYYHDYNLGYKIQHQIEENSNAEIGEFDGYCYSSVRAQAVYRTVDDMYSDGMLNDSEYKFCKTLV